MISQELLSSISKINVKIKEKFLNEFYKTDLEFILSMLVKIWEESWELQQQVLRKYSKPEKFKQEDLESEFADAILSVLCLANILDIDINNALEGKIKIVNKRLWMWI